nr:hypothetical protein [Tanacetum cinerariifolium]
GKGAGIAGKEWGEVVGVMGMVENEQERGDEGCLKRASGHGKTKHVLTAQSVRRINPFKPFREEKSVPNKVRASIRTKPITVSQPHVITKKDVNSDSNSFSSTKQKANVSNTKNLTKLKLQVKKPKKVGSNEILASPNPSKPRSCLRWSPTRIFFDLKGKIIATSECECKFNCSNGDNASYPNLFMVRRIGLFQAYDWESKASHQFCLTVFGNCPLRK